MNDRNHREVTEHEPVATSQQSPDELLRAMRAGGSDAAYELLGRQASVKVWREAIVYLATKAPDVDLETMAHRALRRPPEVVLVLLDLVDSMRTPQAATVARAVSRLRTEVPIVEKAVALRDDIAGETDPHLLLASDKEDLDALYSIVCRELEEQREIVGRLRADVAGFEALESSLTSEYQRLLELGRTVRWTRGSYRYFLRHSLADLALIADVGGTTGERAYRLLQKQVAEPEENEELLAFVPMATRARFVNWALQRENANSHPLRGRFAVRAARRFPESVKRSSLIEAARTRDAELVVDALVAVAGIDPDDDSFDLEFVERINELDEDQARRLVRDLLEVSPRRLRLDLVRADRRSLALDELDGRADVVARSMMGLFPSAADERAVELAALLVEVSERGPVAGEVFAALARDLVRRVPAGMPHMGLVDLFKNDRLRGAVWEEIAELEPLARSALYRLLIDADEPAAAGVATCRLLESVGDLAPDLAGHVVASVFDGAVDPSELAALAPPRAEVLAELATARLLEIERELVAAKALVDEGREAVVAELRSALSPVIERAIDRAAGNAALQRYYRGLLPEGSSSIDEKHVLEEPTTTDPEDELDGKTLAALEQIGVTVITSSTGLVVEFGTSQATGTDRLKYLASLDRRLLRATAAPARSLRDLHTGYVNALGRNGDAERCITDLFEAGSTMRIGLALSPETRGLLLDAARGNDMIVASTWVDHPSLGKWLSDRLGEEPSPPDKGATDHVASLDQGRARHAELARWRERAEHLRHEARIEYLEQSKPSLDELELAADGYIQLWRAFAELGMEQVAVLGSTIPAEDVDPGRYEIVGAGNFDRFVVRGAGLTVGSDVLAKAVLEGIG